MSNTLRETPAFRPMRRFKQQLPPEECVQLLRQEMRGVLSLQGDGGYPYALPIDYVYDDDTNCLYFHCAKEGHKIDAIRRCDKASFCIYDAGYRLAGEWPLHIRSVIVFGRIRILDDAQETIRRVRQLGFKYYPDPKDVDEEIRKAGSSVLCLVLTPEHITGKLVKES